METAPGSGRGRGGAEGLLTPLSAHFSTKNKQPIGCLHFVDK